MIPLKHRRRAAGTILHGLVALACGTAASGCTSSGPAPFILHLIAADGRIADEPLVVLDAVDAIELVFQPDQTRGQDFVMTDSMSFEDGQVRTRLLSATGEYIILMERSYVLDHQRPNGSTFQVDVPLYSVDDRPDPSVRPPSLRVNVLRDGERIAEGRPSTSLPWPLPEGGDGSIVVACRQDSLCKCRDEEGMNL